MSGLRLLVVGSPLPSTTVEALSTCGVEIHRTPTVDEALDRLDRAEFDCVLATVDLDEGDGCPALSEITRTFPDVPFVAAIDDGDESRVRDVLEAGAIDFVRRRDLADHGEPVAHRIECVVTEAQRDSEGPIENVREQLERAANTLTAVQDATADFDLAPEEKIDRVLEVGSERLDYPIAYVTQIESGTREIVAATGDHEHIQPGATDPLDRTYCRKTVTADEPLVVENAPEEGWADDPAFERFGLRCYVGARIVVDAELYGTLCFADEQPRERTVADVQGATVEALARWIGYELERHRYEAELERYEAFVDHSPAGITVLDEVGTITYQSPAIERVFGYEPTDLVGEDAIEFVHPDDRSDVGEAFTALLEDPTSERSFEYRFASPDGNWRWLRSTGDNHLDDPAVEGILLASVDVTERKERELELERTREELRQIIDLVPDPIFAKTRDGEYVLANETVADYYGRTPEEVVGRTDRELLPCEEQARQFREEDLAVIESGAPRRITQETLTTADGETRIFQTIRIPYEVVGSGEEAVLGYAREVTELKEYEQQLEAQRDNLEFLNQVVRHDIRNDLQLVQAYAEQLEEHVDREGRAHLETLKESAENAIDFTSTARDLAEVMLRTDTDTRGVSLRRTLLQELEGIRSAHPDAVLTVDGSIPETDVRGNDMLGAVFRNLLKNAVQHNDEDVPEVTVSAENRDGTVEVRVADNGPGVPDAHKADIFGQGEKGLDSDGTGIGLYLVRELVEGYAGEVRVEDNEPKGAAFVVRLPAVEPDSAE